MATPSWIQYTEQVVGENHPSLSDVANRPGKAIYAMIERLRLGYKEGGGLKVATAGNDVIIKADVREIGGSIYHWDSDLTFTIGPGGSNAGSSTNPSSADMLYIYIDESALPADPATELTAANFIDKTSEPAKSASKHGWYDVDDRCIGAVYHDGTNLVTQDDEGDWIYYLTDLGNDLAAAPAAANTFYDLDLGPKIPVFSTIVWADAQVYSGTTDDHIYGEIRPKGSDYDPNVRTLPLEGELAASIRSIFKTDSSQILQWSTNDTGTYMYFRTLGYYKGGL